MEDVAGLRDIVPYLQHPLVLAGVLGLAFIGLLSLALRSGLFPQLSRRKAGELAGVLFRYGFAIAALTILLGFGLEFFKEHHRARVSDAEVQRLVGEAVERTRQQYEQRADEDRQASAQQLAALTEAFQALAAQRDDPDAPPGIEEALAAAAAGDNAEAEAIFAEIADRKAAAGRAAYAEAAAAARHLGALLAFDDTEKAVAAYRRAVQLDPDNWEGWLGLGDLLVQAGDTAEAEQAFTRLLDLASLQGDASLVALAHTRRGDVQLALGHLPSAEADYLEGLALNRAFIAEAPDDPWHQRELSVSHERIGDVLAAQGDSAGALRAYREGLGIRETLAARDPGNTTWQRDLSVSHNKIGTILYAEGDSAGALDAFRQDLLIAERLAGIDLSNAGWQVDVVASYWTIAQILGEDDTTRADAAELLGKGLAVLERLSGQSRLTTAQVGWIDALKTRRAELLATAAAD